eukprot:1012160-Amphidinium_carterae.1
MEDLAFGGDQREVVRIRFGFHLLAFGGHDALFVHTSAAAAFAPLQPPVDEFDCYNEAFIAANGIPIEKTRRWFFTQSNVSLGLSLQKERM